MPQGEIVEFVCAKCGFSNSGDIDINSAQDKIDSSTTDDTAANENDEQDKNDDDSEHDDAQSDGETKVAAKQED